MKEHKCLQHFGFLAEKQYCSDGLSRRSACRDSEQTFTLTEDPVWTLLRPSTLLSTPALICRENFQKYITNVITNYFTSFIIFLLRPGWLTVSTAPTSRIFSISYVRRNVRSGCQFLSSPLHTRPGSNVNAKPFLPISQEKARHL